MTPSDRQTDRRSLLHLNRREAQGNRRVRIHAVGLPVMLSVPGVSNTTGVRFATLMHLLCRKNGGTLFGLRRL